jgi:hypothetical protein
MISNLELHIQLSHLFHIGFNFITAENTPKPKWRTNRKYRLTRGEFVKRYSDELTLLGVSFGATTRYFIIDIDKDSQYHPNNDITALPKLRQLLEQTSFAAPTVAASIFMDVYLKTSPQFALPPYCTLHLSMRGFRLLKDN